MRYFIYFMLLLITTMVAMHNEDLDTALLLLVLDIFFIFLV